MAQPVFYPVSSKHPASKEPILLIIDNGWASIPQWPEFIQTLRQLLDQSTDGSIPVHLLFTAHNQHNDPLTLVQSRNMPTHSLQLNDFQAFPWPVDREKAAILLNTLLKTHSYQKIYYLSDSIPTHAQDFFIKTLKQYPVYEIRPQSFTHASTTVLLHKPIQSTDHLIQPFDLLPKTIPQNITIQLYDQQDTLIATADKTIPPNTRHDQIVFSLPEPVQDKIHLIKTSPSLGTGSVYYLDSHDNHPIIGLLQNSNTDNVPFTGSLYYLKNALSTLGTLYQGSVKEVMSHPLSILIVSDRIFTDPETINHLQNWIKQGGILVRFSGPLLSNHLSHPGQDSITDPLFPLPLSKDVRILGGKMTWETPQKIAPFPVGSPFAGLPIPATIRVFKQTLTIPGEPFNNHLWAGLKDGTPLITHRISGKGQIIFFHVNSTAEWSTLPLSGLFVSMMERLTRLSRSDGTSLSDHAHPLSLLAIMDQNGALHPPETTIPDITLTELYHTPPSPQHPPGIYGNDQEQHILNLGDLITVQNLSNPVGKTVTMNKINSVYPVHLGNHLILLTILLVLLDMVLSLFMQKPVKKTERILSFILVTFWLHPINGFAHPIPAAALTTRLAYVITNHDSIDQLSKNGLDGLSQLVIEQTTLMLAPADGVNPGKDNLAYYPLLYWPITADIQPDPARDRNLNLYLNHGGILVLDTQGHDPTISTTPIHPNHFAGEAIDTQKALKTATENLAIPALSQLSNQHVLSKSFYILHDYPGQYDAMPVWVSQSEASLNDGVSSVIIGENNWAYAWASIHDHTLTNGFFPNTERQHILSYRFGINLVIYALTGNYKTDQVHASALIQQLGKDSQ